MRFRFRFRFRPSLRVLRRSSHRLPFEAIGRNLGDTQRSGDALFAQLDTGLAPQTSDTLAAAQRALDTAHATWQQDAPLRADMQQAFAQLMQTLRSLGQRN